MNWKFGIKDLRHGRRERGVDISFRPSLQVLRPACIFFLWLTVLLPLPAAAPGTATQRIIVDQFGYQPDMVKIAVLSDPQMGFNAVEAYTPGPQLEVRRWAGNEVVFSGAPVVWNGGATHAQSGDKVWWFDFSAVKQWGDYYVYDPAHDLRSFPFRIHHRVYDGVLQQAQRMFFYQRRGFAKQAPYTDSKWADGASHLGTRQDPQCRLVTDQGNAALEKDLRGGWFDAGDYNKYTNFTFSTLTDLLLAYEQNPYSWGDDFGLPESGNGVPDLLDEIKWELDWLLRMQNANGSVLSKVGVLGFAGISPPSADTSFMYYGAASTSATFCAARHFAHAARLYQSAGQAAYAAALQNAAVAAWNWGVANPAVVFSNAVFSSANPEVDAYTRGMYQLCAAVQLYALTGETAYKTYVESHYTEAHPLQWTYWYAFEAPLQDALLYYTTLPGITPAVATAIRNSKQSSMQGGEFLPAYTNRTDAYRAALKNADYTWNSNQTKSSMGQIFWQQIRYNLDPANAASYRAAAAGYLHYFHGVNPLSRAYLSNMYAFGAEHCVNEFYHSWFGDGTEWDNALTSPKGPPPGYIPGGANPVWGGPDPSYTGPPLVPPAGQPIQKSYKDWNTSWPENSWEITEAGIYTQAAYLHLLAGFQRPLAYADWTTGHGLAGDAALPGADPDGNGVANLLEYAFDLSPAASNAGALPRAERQSHTVGGQNGRYLTVTFPRQIGAGNVTYEVQASGDLAGPWTPVCTAAGTAVPAGAGFVAETGTGSVRSVTARDTVEEGSASRRFLRIRVTLN
jgi:endoglucanase